MTRLRVRGPVKEGYRRCYGGCGKDKSLSEFYGKTNRCKECCKKYLKIYRSRHKKKVNGYKNKYPEKEMARKFLRAALLVGLIEKGDCLMKDDSCSKRIEAHHHLGYEREHYLDIQWVCKHHHRIIDKISFGK